MAASQLQFDSAGLFFMGRTVKDECYANQLETIQELKYEIKVAIDEIRAHTVENVLKNWIDRMRYCAASRGSHLNEIVFHV